MKNFLLLSLNVNARATTFISLFCRQFFPHFWSLFFQKHIANHFFRLIVMEKDVVKHVYTVARCLSFRNKDAEGESGAGETEKRDDKGSDLMEMVKITQKKDDMKKENRGKKFHDNESELK